MLETNGNSQLALRGTDLQDFNEFQRVSGTYPYQEGLQRRIPGKTIIQIYNGEIGSIFVFYMVFGRTYTIIDFGSLEITEIVTPPITIPALPPTSSRWYDDFSSYLVDTISRLWGAGIWLVGIGVCETIIEGTIDYFLVDDNVFYQSIATGLQPIPAPPNDLPPVSPILPPVGPQIPNECSQLPNQNYQVLDTGIYITSLQRKGGSADTGEIASGEFDPPPPAIPHPYNDTAGSGFSAQENIIRQHYNNGFAWVTRSRSSGYLTQIDYDFNVTDFPDDTTFFLVGTKSLSDGTGGLFPNLTTTCAMLQLATVGERAASVQISVPLGIDTDAIANEGLLSYTELRAYSSSF